MRVYVLQYTWDHEDGNGSEVLSVYEENALPDAQRAMREAAARIRALENNDFWEEDYSQQDDFSITLGNSGLGPYDGYGVPVVYRWEIHHLPVLEHGADKTT